MTVCENNIYIQCSENVKNQLLDILGSNTLFFQAFIPCGNDSKLECYGTESDVYIENMGYLWVIWDYGIASKLTFEKTYYDYYKITNAFKNQDPKGDGWVDPKDFIYDAKTKALTDDLISLIVKVDTEQFVWYDKLLKSKLFSRTDRKPPDNEIINLGNPYILKK